MNSVFPIKKNGVIAQQQNADLLKLFSVCYLILPVILFLIFWFKIEIVVPAIVVVIVVCVSYFRNLHLTFNPNILNFSLKKHILLPAFALFICLFSGIGGFVFQGDFLKHYAMLHDLVYLDWPVIYTQSSEITFLNYYFAYFLPPAFLAKITLPELVDNYIIIWTALGLYLSFRWFICFAGNKNIWLPVCFMLFLGGQDFLYAFLKFFLQSASLENNDSAWQIFQQEISTVCVFHNTVLRYPTNFFAISWAPQHLIGAWLVTSVLIKNYLSQSNQKYSIFILSFLPIWSVFNAVGLIPIMLACYLRNRNGIFSWQNILGGGVILILTGFFYLAHSSVSEQGWLWEFIPLKALTFKWMLFLLFEFGYIAVVIHSFIIKSEWRYLYLSSLIFMSLLPVYVLGYMNDLLMRAAVPSIFVINLLAFLYYQQNRFKYKKVIMVVILVGVLLPQVLTIASYMPEFTKFHVENGFSESRVRVQNSKILIELTDENWFNTQYFGRNDSFYYKYLAR
ncbi:hypothetical protein [Chondrinema litorale]|uniref:hypothetical protein n=1 Tax=Chondrinema litorale TaxID=2994555 RepID=UPI0025436B3C|nr:hypothetical protein [Chondrinema litorale]UZR92373.1 hypothetical protein OQ292_10925 [Chondrinema litorale]